MPDLIVRLPNWLGDTVMAVPMLGALRHAYPGERIAVAGPWASILVGQELADVIVDYPRSWAGRLATADTVRELRSEVAVLLPNSFEAAATARYWGARRRVGFATEGRSWLLTDAMPLPAPRRHQVDEYLLLLGPLGVTTTVHEPRLRVPAVDSEARREVRDRLRAVGVPESDALVIGVHLGAAYGSSKLWPTARVIELCAEAKRDDAIPVLLGPPDGAAAAAEIVAATGVRSLVGGDRPEILTALLSEIGALVGGDTGVVHLAAALGTPVIALFGPTDPGLTAPRGPVTVLTHPVPCAPCFYRTCPIEHPCMQGIEGRRVYDGVRAARRPEIPE